MKIVTVLRHVCVVVAVATSLQACGNKSQKQAVQPQREEPQSSNVTDAVDAKLVLTLVNDAAGNVTDEQMLAVLAKNCQSCHNAQNSARLNLGILPSATQSAEIRRRIELPMSTQGHMPVGSALPTEEQARLVGWIEQQLVAASSDALAGMQVEVRETSLDADAPPMKVEALGGGRFSVTLGQRLSDAVIGLAVVLTNADKQTKVVPVDVIVPKDGVVYKSISTLGLISGPAKVVTPGPDTPARETPRTADATTAAVIELHLTTSGSPAIADSTALSIMRVECQACHNNNNTPRWDLTSVPARDRLSEIARRINLDRLIIGHMPMNGGIPPGDLETLNRWLSEQQNPTEALSGYSLQASLAGDGATLESSDLDHGRSRISLGNHRPGTSVTVEVLVTGADGLVKTRTLNVVVTESGIISAEAEVAARDTVAPTVSDKLLTVKSLTATSARIYFKSAEDNRPSEHLTYSVYRFDNAIADKKFDSVDDVEAKGMRVGEDLTTAQQLAVDGGALLPSHLYAFNVVARDRTGNKSVYQKLEVQTLPEVLCDELAAAGSIQAWRDDLATRLDGGVLSDAKAVIEINQCFPVLVPQCVQRTLSFAERNDIATAGTDGTIVNMPQKRPPDEIKDIVAGKYWIPDNIEQTAKDKGWTAVRYKSRHAGGFDSETPNLLMVYVPGDKVDPPVKFDRWLNFPLIKDDDEPALGLPQHPRPKFGPPKREEYQTTGINYPSTFTMVSQDRAEATKPAVVYFQMFTRGSGAAFSPGGAVGLSGCVRCHPNGLRAISPLGYDLREGEESLADDDWKAVEYINRMMIEGAGYKTPLWGDGVSQGVTKPLYRAARGPTMGPTTPVNGISRTREFIMGGVVNGQQVQGCFNRHSVIEVKDIFNRAPGMVVANYRFQLSAVPDINPDKVIAAMTCEGCHVNGQRWPLNDKTSYSQVQYKILGDQSMPYGLHRNPLDAGNDTGQVVDQLTKDERFALTNCLEAEFELEKANVKAWMTQDSCQQ